MRMLVVLTSLIFLLPAVVAAQEEAAPRATIFGGYSYLRNSRTSATAAAAVSTGGKGRERLTSAATLVSPQT